MRSSLRKIRSFLAIALSVLLVLTLLPTNAVAYAAEGESPNVVGLAFRIQNENYGNAYYKLNDSNDWVLLNDMEKDGGGTIWIKNVSTESIVYVKISPNEGGRLGAFSLTRGGEATPVMMVTPAADTDREYSALLSGDGLEIDLSKMAGEATELNFDLEFREDTSDSGNSGDSGDSGNNNPGNENPGNENPVVVPETSNNKLRIVCQSNAVSGGKVHYKLNNEAEYSDAFMNNDNMTYDSIDLENSESITLFFESNENYVLDATRGVTIRRNGIDIFKANNEEGMEEFLYFSSIDGYTVSLADGIEEGKEVKDYTYEIEFGFNYTGTGEPGENPSDNPGENPNPRPEIYGGDICIISDGGAPEGGNIQYSFDDEHWFDATNGTVISKDAVIVGLGDGSLFYVRYSLNEGYKLDDYFENGLSCNNVEIDGDKFSLEFGEDGMASFVYDRENATYVTIRFMKEGSNQEIITDEGNLDIDVKLNFWLYEQAYITEYDEENGQDIVVPVTDENGKPVYVYNRATNDCFMEGIRLNGYNVAMKEGYDTVIKGGYALDSEDTNRIEFHDAYGSKTNGAYLVNVEEVDGETEVTKIEGSDIELSEVDGMQEYLAELAPAEEYNIALIPGVSEDLTIIWTTSYEIADKWIDGEEGGEFADDMYVENGRVEVLSIVRSGETIYDAAANVDSQDEYGAVIQIDKEFGYLQLKRGDSITLKLIPNYGYQLYTVAGGEVETSAAEDLGLEAGEQVSTFTIDNIQGNIHFSGVFVKTDNENEVAGNVVVQCADYYVAQSENDIPVENGTLKIVVNDAELTENAKDAVEELSPGCEIINAVTVDYYNVFGKGTVQFDSDMCCTNDYWEVPVTDFNGKMHVGLSLSEMCDENGVPLDENVDVNQYGYEIVREHNGEYEFIDSVMNSEGIDFESDKFSTFIIVKRVKNVVSLNSIAIGEDEDDPDNIVENVAELNGGGRYAADEQVVIEYYDVSGYEFRGWYFAPEDGSWTQEYLNNEENCFSYSRCVEFNMGENDMVLYAVFTPVAEVKITFERVNGAKIGIMPACGDENTVVEEMTDDVYYFPAGSYVNFVAIEDEENPTEEYQWFNGSGKAIGVDAELCITITRNMTIRLVKISESGGTTSYVEYATEFSQLLKAETVSAEDFSFANAPVPPTKIGYVFSGWSINCQDIVDEETVKAEIGTTGSIILWPLYELDVKTVSLAVYIDGEKSESLSSEEVMLGAAYSISTDRELDGKIFSCWSTDATGENVISYNPSCYIKLTKDTVIYAIYAEEEKEAFPIINITNTYISYTSDTSNKISFEATYDIPEDFTIVEIGMLRSVSVDDPEQLVLNAEGVKTLASSLDTYKGVLTVNINVGTYLSTTVYVRGYMILLDPYSGNYITVYSDVVGKSFSDMAVD